jgi:hypothetical protein
MNIESDIQSKIIVIEKNILKFVDLNVCAQIKANNKIIDMRTRRISNTDGFYMITLNMGYTECHAILIYRKTQTNGNVIFYIYDPNGRSSALKYDYKTNIAFNKPFEIDLSMSPEKSINEEGRCALWCIIVIILWNAFNLEERMIALNMFNSKMIEAPIERNNFMMNVCNLLRKHKDFTAGTIRDFFAKVESLITNLQIKF